MYTLKPILDPLTPIAFLPHSVEHRKYLFQKKFFSKNVPGVLKRKENGKKLFGGEGGNFEGAPFPQTRGGASIKLVPLDSPNHEPYTKPILDPLTPICFSPHSVEHNILFIKNKNRTPDSV